MPSLSAIDAYSQAPELRLSRHARSEHRPVADLNPVKAAFTASKYPGLSSGRSGAERRKITAIWPGVNVGDVGSILLPLRPPVVLTTRPDRLSAQVVGL